LTEEKIDLIFEDADSKGSLLNLDNVSLFRLCTPIEKRLNPIEPNPSILLIYCGFTYIVIYVS
jgi:hypothetical protein